MLICGIVASLPSAFLDQVLMESDLNLSLSQRENRDNDECSIMLECNLDQLQAEDLARRLDMTRKVVK